MGEENKREELETGNASKPENLEEAIPEILEAEKGDEGKEEKIVPEQGVSTDKFDVSEPWLDGKRVDDSVRGIEISYDLRGDEVAKALKYFQKKTLYRKNAIFSAILGIIALLYLQAVFTSPSYTLGYILMALSLAVIWLLWFLPARHIRAAAAAADISGDTYHLEVCEKGLLMPQQDGRYLVGFDRPGISVTEFPDIFLIIASKEKVFVLPKRCIPEEDQKELTAVFQAALGPRYNGQMDSVTEVHGG